MATLGRKLTPYVRLGILGAITTSMVIHLFVWFFSLGQTFVHFLLGLVLFLPVPIIIGSLAGLLTWAIGGRPGSRFAYWFGFLATGAGYYYGTYISEYLYQWSQNDWQFRASAIVGPLIAGVLVEVAMILVVLVWRMIAKLLTRKS